LAPPASPAAIPGDGRTTAMIRRPAGLLELRNWTQGHLQWDPGAFARLAEWSQNARCQWPCDLV